MSFQNAKHYDTFQIFMAWSSGPNAMQECLLPVRLQSMFQILYNEPLCSRSLIANVAVGGIVIFSALTKNKAPARLR